MTAALSPGVFFHSHINVQCVRFVFALLNACADSQTEVLASIFDITLLFPYVYFSWCKDTGGGGALQQCKYLKERHFNLILEVERGVSASGICGSVFIPSCECELVMCVCVCARTRRPCKVAATESLSPPHTPASLQDWAQPPTHPPNFSCLVSPLQRQIQPQLLLLYSLYGFLGLRRAGLAQVQQPVTLPLYQSSIQRLWTMRFQKENQLCSSQKTPERQKWLLISQ